jgi:hypothetical protein
MITLGQTKTAVGANITAFFQATGGTSPYVYSVLPNGAGGSIDSSTGLYTAPSVINSSPNQAYDVIQAKDNAGLKTTSSILVGTPLVLFCDILQTQLGLDNNHIFEWDQKVFQPTDYGLYIIISVINCKPFGNNTYILPDGISVEQDVNMSATFELDIISRGPAARDQKELVLLALNSIYSQQQQESNSFYIGKLSTNFINLSQIDGAAIPYRYRISFTVQYTVSLITALPYFGTFQTPTIAVNP